MIGRLLCQSVSKAPPSRQSLAPTTLLRFGSNWWISMPLRVSRPINRPGQRSRATQQPQQRPKRKRGAAAGQAWSKRERQVLINRSYGSDPASLFRTLFGPDLQPLRHSVQQQQSWQPSTEFQLVKPLVITDPGFLYI